MEKGCVAGATGSPPRSRERGGGAKPIPRPRPKGIPAAVAALTPRPWVGAWAAAATPKALFGFLPLVGVHLDEDSALARGFGDGGLRRMLWLAVLGTAGYGARSS